MRAVLCSGLVCKSTALYIHAHQVADICCCRATAVLPLRMLLQTAATARSPLHHTQLLVLTSTTAYFPVPNIAVRWSALRPRSRGAAARPCRPRSSGGGGRRQGRWCSRQGGGWQGG